MIKNIFFDFGGVLFDLLTDRAIERFGQIGLPDASQRLDKYQQRGIFAELETGAIPMETFQEKLEDLCGKKLNLNDIVWAWMGYVGNVDERKMRYMLQLKERGYHIFLLSNINPYIMKWAHSEDFCSLHLPIDAFVEKMYLSYEVGVLKPERRFFEHVLNDTHVVPQETIFVDDGPKNIVIAQSLGLQTLCPENNKYWVDDLEAML